jgi:hypothetical protein
MDWAGKQLNIKEMSDWYNISVKVTYILFIGDSPQELQNIGGSSLLNIYKVSPTRLLAAVYPEFDWVPWEFERCNRNVWTNVEDQRAFVEWAGKKWGINDMSDWYKVGHKVRIAKS